MEESEVCSLPGGLASEVSNSEVTVVKGASQQLNVQQEDVITHSANNMESIYGNHNNETEEDFPRFTTKELRDHFERTIEEAAPSKQMKSKVVLKVCDH
ncbi:hypothetical protein CRUP_010658 [Coryphaenoides rupestris]|nr:hypothetical protein CRUP_010658 [Coryphaenoides rupestris]